METIAPAVRIGLSAVASACLLLGSPTHRAEAQETRISGLFFGDYYAVVSHQDDAVDGAHGFWARRMYLTVDHRFDPTWDVRVRFEALSPGDFQTSAALEPFLKDLWVRWRQGEHQVLVGISPSPTWNLWEAQWGYRHVEKTPLDLYRMGSSRDFGVSVLGSFDRDRTLRYHVMVGNGAGVRSETNKGKKVMGSLQFFSSRGLTLEAYADWEDRSGEEERTTAAAHAVLEGDRGRLGLMATHQLRRIRGAPNVNVDVISLFGVLDTGSRTNLLARWDRLATPIPGAHGIAYFRMAPTSRGHFFLLGVDLALAERVHLVPNLELVTYDDSALSSDVFLKTTFSVTF